MNTFGSRAISSRMAWFRASRMVSSATSAPHLGRSALGGGRGVLRHALLGRRGQLVRRGRLPGRKLLRHAVLADGGLPGRIPLGRLHVDVRGADVDVLVDGLD